MSTTNDSAAFIANGGAKYFAFREIGTTITGTICEEPVTRQQTDPANPGTLLFWPDGNPKTVLVITLQTDLRGVDPSDDGRRSVWAQNPGGIRNALIKAVRDAGAKQLDIGGKLTVAYTGDGDRRHAHHNPPKIYSVSYVPPAGDSAAFLAEEESIPPNMTRQEWAKLPPEARAALANLVPAK